MMKKISKAFILALCAIFMVGVASCDSEDNVSGDDGGNPPVASVTNGVMTFSCVLNDDFYDVSNVEFVYSITPGDTVREAIAKDELVGDSLYKKEVVIDKSKFPTKVFAKLDFTPRTTMVEKNEYDFHSSVIINYRKKMTDGQEGSNSLVYKEAPEYNRINRNDIKPWLEYASKELFGYFVQIDSKGNAIK